MIQISVQMSNPTLEEMNVFKRMILSLGGRIPDDVSKVKDFKIIEKKYRKTSGVKNRAY